jgi:hypothetical protein
VRVGSKAFDRKFGADLLRELPESPGVYLFKDDTGEVLYAGKAKNLRHRLARYRNAGRRKAHRKMRVIVRESHSLEVRLQPSEREALLAENELIRTLRPRFNVDGAFDFLYPAIGVGGSASQRLLCFTTQPDAFGELALAWHGAFRPRLRAREAFDALVQLLGAIGHLEPRAALPEAPHLRGSRMVGLRRLPDPVARQLSPFLHGESDALLGLLFESLLESPDARRDAAEVQQVLRYLRGFYRRDVLRLRDARIVAGRSAPFVPQGERDALFIAARMPVADEDDEPPV